MNITEYSLTENAIDRLGLWRNLEERLPVLCIGTRREETPSDLSLTILYRDISSRAMGVLWSYLGLGGVQGKTDDPDPVTGLTSRERYLIKSSWAGPRQKPTESGVALFLLFFKNHPEYKQTFPFRDVPDEDLPSNKRFHAHANSVIYAFSSVVDAIDDPDLLVTILSRVGESHRPRNITEKSFFDLKVTLIELFTSLFTKEEVEAWKKALDVAIGLIAKSFRETKLQ